MADSSLFTELARARSLPSRASRDAQAGFGAVNEGIQGYLQGQEIGDSLRRRKLQQQTLSEALGGVPLDEGIQNLTGESGPIQNENIRNRILLDKINRGKVVPPVKTIGLPQALLGLSGVVKTPSKEDQAYLSSFPKDAQGIPQIPESDYGKYFSARATQQNNIPKNDFYGAKGGQIRLDQLPSNMAATSVPGAAAQVKMAARQGKSLIANATSPQNLKLASVDLTRAVARMAPDAATIGESSYGNSLPTLLGQLTQKIDADPSSPDVPKLRRQIYDTLNELDKSATPLIQRHLDSYQRTIGPLDKQTIDQELGTTLPDIPFNDGGSSAKTYQKTAKNAQGVTIGTNDNWQTWEPVQGGQ